MLRAAGTERANLVRTDQYYTTVEAVPPYQYVRREFLRGRIPPSTSIAQQRFLLPARRHEHPGDGGGAGERLRGRSTSSTSELKGRPTSGYSPALTVGDFIFIPGITSMAVGDEPRRNGVAAAALMAEGAQWGGQPIKLETEFIITRRIVPSLALAGASLEDVVHAQVYLTRREDYSAFNEVWSRHFGAAPPTLSIVPCIEHGLAPYDGGIEINVLAAKPGSAAGKRHIDAGVATAFRNQPQAVKAGDLLFISGLMAIDRDGLVPSRRGGSAPALFLLLARGAGGGDHRQHRAAVRGRRHLARQCRARAAVPHRHRRVLSGLQGLGAPPRRPCRCRSRRSRCRRPCRCRAPPS